MCICNALSTGNDRGGFTDLGLRRNSRIAVRNPERACGNAPRLGGIAILDCAGSLVGIRRLSGSALSGTNRSFGIALAIGNRNMAISVPRTSRD